MIEKEKFLEIVNILNSTKLEDGVGNLATTLVLTGNESVDFELFMQSVESIDERFEFLMPDVVANLYQSLQKMQEDGKLVRPSLQEIATAKKLLAETTKRTKAEKAVKPKAEKKAKSEKTGSKSTSDRWKEKAENKLFIVMLKNAGENGLKMSDAKKADWNPKHISFYYVFTALEKAGQVVKKDDKMYYQG